MVVGTRERTSLENTKAIKCAVCRKDYTPECDFNQGRCPHHPAMLNIQPKDTSRGHFYVSLVKSGLRIVAGVFLIDGNLLVAGSLLILAEGLGIIEELV
jgi:hypothetical protein